MENNNQQISRPVNIFRSQNQRVFQDDDGTVYQSFTTNPDLKFRPGGKSNITYLSGAKAYHILPYTTVKLSKGMRKVSILEYVRSCLAQLFLNNNIGPARRGEDYVIRDFYHASDIFLKWIVNWRGNEELNVSGIGRIVENEADNLTGSEQNYITHIVMVQDQEWWYTADVEEIEDGATRQMRKRYLRDSIMGSAIREEIREAYEDFTRIFLSVPTTKHLQVATRHSRNTIHKHGKEYVHSKSEFTNGLIQNHKVEGETQKEVLEKVNESLNREEGSNFFEEEDKRTIAIGAVKKYWNKQLGE